MNARRWVPLVAGVLLALVCVRLGMWQLDRAAFKRELHARITANEAVRAAGTAASLQAWQRVQLRGSWVSGQTVFLDNRSYQHQPGYEVLSLLQLDNAGGFVVVNRGWVKAGAQRAQLPDVAQPDGVVTLVGRVREPDLTSFRLDDGRDPGKIWQRADPALFAGRLGKPVAPYVIQQENDAGDGLVRDWPRHENEAYKHQAYALQWFAFACLSAGLAGWFAWRRARPAR
ncbi:MAG: SURF1 family protein [Rhodocyclaceae bacterium]